MKIRVTSPVAKSARSAQLRGLFDLPDQAECTEQWEPEFDLSLRPWNIGLITGPSGSGKSTIAKALWPNAPQPIFEFAPDEAVIDAFPTQMNLREITEILSSVGFSSPPSWLKPYHVLSTGQKFRVDMALALASTDGTTPILYDEFTSVVDRTVAQIGSAAVARNVRKRNLQFIAVTCHSDVEDWLQPDWIYLPAENLFSWRSLWPRPRITLDIIRCATSAWTLFAPHHYLSGEINPSSQCWIASIKDRPVAFTAWLHFFGRGVAAKREHRTVCLPDFQGIGIGNHLSATIASMYLGLGFRATSTTTHPGMIASRARSPDWIMTRAPALNKLTDSVPHANTRLTAGFAYKGKPMNSIIARALSK
jgi:hypothetical protein